LSKSEFVVVMAWRDVLHFFLVGETAVLSSVWGRWEQMPALLLALEQSVVAHQMVSELVPRCLATCHNL